MSLSQTAEGALGKVGDMLQRMRELAVQAGNATNSTADRKALQAEVKQLTDEIDRVAKSTSFNGQKVIDGTFAGAVFQVGANSGDNITVGGLVNSTAKGLADVVYAYDHATGIVASNISGTDLDAITTPNTLQIQITNGVTVDLGSIKAASSGAERLGQMVEAINRKTVDTGVVAFLSQDSSGNYTVDVQSSKLTSSGDAEVATLVGFSATNFYAATTVGATNGASLLATSTTTDSLGLDTLTVDTQANAWVALKKIDSAIDQVNSGPC